MPDRHLHGMASASALTQQHHPRARLAVWALACAALLSACGGGGGGGDVTPPPDTGTPDQQALALSRSGDLLGFVRRKLRERQAQRLLSPGLPFAGAALDTSVAVTADQPLPASSNTLVQEAGVDEADLLKTDGEILYALDQRDSTAPRLILNRRLPDGSLQTLPAVPVDTDGSTGLNMKGLLLRPAGGALAVLGQHWLPLPLDPACDTGCPVALPVDPLPGTSQLPKSGQSSRVTVQRFDVRDPAAAQAGTRLAIDGHLVDARQLGDQLVVVTRHSPRLAADVLPASTPAEQREAAIAALTVGQVLPRLQVNGGPAQPLVSETECWLQPGNAALAIEITTITVVDLGSTDLARRSRCFAGGSEALYMSASSLYLASSRQPTVTTVSGVLRYDSQARTDIHKFALADGTVAYRGTGTVAGHLGWQPELKPYRLSEQGTDLRVLSFTGTDGWATLGGVGPAGAAAAPPSPATLTVLRDSGQGVLQTLATLPNSRRPQAIGKPDEQVRGVRFIGNRGYVVTFRQVDPLYVLDLSDPADPRTAGALELPGFSDQLVPLNEALLLGLGRDVSDTGRVGGLKLVLFDVADAAAPQVRASLVLGAAGSGSAADSSPHGLNLLALGNQVRAALPVALTSTDHGASQAGLQTLNIDLSAGTLSTHTLLAPTDGPALDDLWLQRSVQIGAQVYWLHGGQVSAHGW